MFSLTSRIGSRLTHAAIHGFVACAACAQILDASGDYVEKPADGGASGGSSGSDAEAGSDGQTGGAGAGGSGGAFDAGDASDANDSTPPFCELYAEKVCAAYSNCCIQNSFGYDESGCRSSRRALCETLQAKADGGSITIDPSLLEDCANAFAGLSCQLSTYGALFAVYQLRACSSVFAGSGKVGDACDEVTPCAPDPTPQTVVACYPALKKCIRVRIAGDGSACPINYSFGTDDYKICDDGLVCSTSGLCKPAAQLGGDCAGLATCADTYRCLLNKCVDGLAPGVQCANSDACASKYCIQVDGGGVCSQFVTLVTPALCSGQRT